MGFQWGIIWSDFAGADFGLGAGLDFKIYGINGDIVVFEGGFDEI